MLMLLAILKCSIARNARESKIMTRLDLPTATSYTELDSLGSISRLLLRIYVPNDIIRQSINVISGSLRHLGKSFRLGLVLECITGEIDAGAMYVGFDDDVDTADAVKWHFHILVGVAIAFERHIAPFCLVFFVAWDVASVMIPLLNLSKEECTFGEDDILIERGGELESFRRFLPGVVIN